MVQGADMVGNLLTVKEVAERIRVSVQTVYDLMNRGHLAFTNVGTRSQKVRRIAARELDRFLKERFVGAA